MIDPAMVRPGRLDKLLYVDLPSTDERAEIMRTMLRKLPLGRIDGAASQPTGGTSVGEAVEGLVRERCEGYSGADLAALVREAGVVALKRTLGSFSQPQSGSGGAGGWGSGGATDTVDGAPTTATPVIVVDLPDFVAALEKIGPSVSVAQRKKYQALRNKFAGLPVRVGKDEEEKRVEDKMGS
jgi:ribosome biogenesis ATPase